MKAAIESLGGVQGVSVILCDLPTVPKVEAPKWEGVSFINNFENHKDGIRTWREYGIGRGNVLRCHFSLAEKHPIPHLNAAMDAVSLTTAFVAMKAKPNKSQHMKTQPDPITQTRRVNMQLKTSSFLVRDV